MVTLTSKFYVQREQTASLNCEVEGNPIPSIYWSPCDLPSICCNGQYLSISRVQTSRANYTCTAVNNLGSDSRTTVLSKFQDVNFCHFIFGCAEERSSVLLGNSQYLSDSRGQTRRADFKPVLP